MSGFERSAAHSRQSTVASSATRKHCCSNAQIIRTSNGTRRHRGARLTAEWSIDLVVGGREESSIEGQEAPCVKRVRLVRRDPRSQLRPPDNIKTCSPRPFVCCSPLPFLKTATSNLYPRISQPTRSNITHTQSLFTTRALPLQYKMGMAFSHDRYECPCR